MKSIVIYYTFGGFTKKEAERLAAEHQASLCRVREAHERSFLGAFVPGGYQAMRRKATAIKSLDIRLQDYDRIIIGCPVWAGYPAPAFNSIMELLPKGKEVEVFLCSGGGETPKSKQGTKALVEKRGCNLVSYRDVKTNAKPGKMKE
jgi:flavodoxin